MNLQIYEEASDWIVKHRNGDLDAQEKRAFDAWLRESPHHVRAYLEMSSVWEDVPSLLPSWNLSADELITRARADDTVVSLTVKEPHPSSSIPPSAPRLAKETSSASARRRVSFFSALAASLLITCISLGWLYLQHGLYTTGVGEQRLLTLADRSIVELNARSRIRIRYTEDERRVDLLEGQALFHVAKNKARPFVVHAGNSSVLAVGTAFDVYKKSSGTIVTVVEGQVAVVRSESLAARSAVPPARAPEEALPDRSLGNRRGGTPVVGSEVTRRAVEGAILLAASEQLTVTPTAIAPPKRINVAAATAWTRRSLVFDSSPLTEVAHEFNRYNTRRLVIEDPQLADFLVSGVFSSVEPTLLLRFLRTQPELVVEETETEIRITKR